MKNKLMILATVSILAIGGLAFGFNSSSNVCPLEGTSECPKINCPLAGTLECPYDMKAAELPACCKKK